jgi:acyl-CoA synthetase (AMP-forming)/AMP-acid ligase II
VAAGLHDMGVRSGSVVSWQLPTTLEAPVLMAALARLGAVQNPVISLLREREVGFIVKEVGTDLLIVPREWRGFAHGEMAKAMPTETLILNFDDTPSTDLRLPTGTWNSAMAPHATEGDGRWVYYSSGTTSDPKGVRHNDESLLASSNGIVRNIGIRQGDVYPIAWPFTHIGGAAMLTGVLRSGGTLVLFDTFDPTTTPERMAAHRPTILGSAVPFFNAYIAAQRRNDAVLFPALRACVGGGAASPESVNREVSGVLGVPGVVGAWGLTEFPVATSETPSDPMVGSSVGRPTDGVMVRVVKDELRLKGPQCFLGYVDESLNADAFDDEGWFRTGDLGSIDGNGRVRIEGRRKDIIIRNAENISALEIEEALLTHPKVADVAVVGIPDDVTGERVCAVIVGADEGAPTLQELVVHCQDHGLARYKCPERLQVVDVLPRTSMGKIFKRGLPLRSHPVQS